MKKREFIKNFSQRLANLFNGRTQTAVSKQLKCSQGVISKYLDGKIPDSFLFLFRLTEEYEVDLHLLITGNPSPSVEKLLNKLKPHILSYLTQISQMAQDCRSEQFDLLQSDFPRPKEVQQQIEMLQKQVEELHKFYDQEHESINEALEPYGFKISDRLPPTWRKI